jgi:TPR repeat protein
LPTGTRQPTLLFTKEIDMSIDLLRPCALAAVAGALSLAVTAVRADEWSLPVSAAEIWAVADEAFDAGRHAEALAGYEMLARTADPKAARRAGELLLYGQGLLPPTLPYRLPRAAAWLTLAAALGDTDAGALWSDVLGPKVSAEVAAANPPALIARVRP